MKECATCKSHTREFEIDTHRHTSKTNHKTKTPLLAQNIMSTSKADEDKKRREVAATQAFEHYDNNQFLEAHTSLDSLAPQVAVEKDAIVHVHPSFGSTNVLLFRYQSS